MAQWYCLINAQQYGGVGEDVLQAWAREGRLRPTDLVWREGMPGWVPALAIPGLFPGAYVPSPSAGAMATVRPPGGTSGQTPNAELMARARERLRGDWGTAIGFCLLLMLIQMGINAVPYLGALISLVLTGPIQLGAVIFFISFSRRGYTELGMLFWGFRNFANALLAYLLITLVVLGCMLVVALPGVILGLVVGLATETPEAGFIVGGILAFIPVMVASVIVSLCYSQTFYMMADDPTLGAWDALCRSKEIMRGHKGKLFCLALRFIGWVFLCLLTCGIGFIWLWPYVAVTYAMFYDDLRAPALS